MAADQVQDDVAVKTWKEKILGVEVHFYVLRLQQSFVVWVGKEPPQLDALSVAMPTRFDPQPISTHLLGDENDLSSSTLAKRLAKKTGCQCFVSLNITDTTLHAKIEDYLVKSINDNPRTFYF